MVKDKSNYIDYTDIDELILPIIKILNQKGYETLYSCSGHIEKMYGNNCYIMFKEECLPNKIPNGFILEDDKYYNDNYYPFKKEKNQITIRKIYDSNNYLNRLKDIYNTMLDLYTWASTLKNKENNNDQ